MKTKEKDEFIEIYFGDEAPMGEIGVFPKKLVRRANVREKLIENTTIIKGKIGARRQIKRLREELGDVC